MAIVINNKFEHGDVVYLKTDPEQSPAIVICFEVYKAGEIRYEIIRGITTSYHYDFELSYEKNILVNV